MKNSLIRIFTILTALLVTTAYSAQSHFGTMYFEGNATSVVTGSYFDNLAAALSEAYPDNSSDYFITVTAVVTISFFNNEPSVIIPIPEIIIRKSSIDKKKQHLRRFANIISGSLPVLINSFSGVDGGFLFSLINVINKPIGYPFQRLLPARL